MAVVEPFGIAFLGTQGTCRDYEDEDGESAEATIHDGLREQWGYTGFDTLYDERVVRIRYLTVTSCTCRPQNQH
jgi:hypothetical protein